MRGLWQGLCGVWLLAAVGYGQSTTGSVLGTVLDPSGAAVTDGRVTVRNVGTNDVRETVSTDEGRFRVPLLPAGSYELTVEKAGFAKYVQQPFVLRLNQDAEFTVRLALTGTTETVTVNADAPVLNTTNAEISTYFDTKRIAELPLTTNRNMLNLALSVPGVSQISSGQSGFANSGNIGTEGTGVNFSVNGMRLRSNNFMVDGSDANSPSVSGLQQPLNNPDIVAEFRIVTNQFAPEYGRAAGSVVNIITKSGTNEFHGSAFWFHNSNKLSTRSNLEKSAGFRDSPFRIENQFGGTLGGPVIRDKTFFFGSLQRWTDRRQSAGATIRGVPTEEGRRVLNELAGTRTTVRALLDNLPPAQSALTTAPISITVNGRTGLVPQGVLTTSSPIKFDDWQYSGRIDHRFNDRHTLGGRYLDDDSVSAGTGQATPVGLTNSAPSRSRALNAFLNSTLSPTIFNELRASYSRRRERTDPVTPDVALRIPSIEVPQLGLTGFNASTARTAIGYGLNLPQSGTFNNYQLAESISVLRGSHSMKFGIDFRRQEQFADFFPNTRGRLEYPTLQNLIDDQANVAQINSPLPGGELIQYYRYYDYFFFLQDEWRLRPNLTLTYGLRYESPGNPFDSLAFYNQRAVAANNNDERFRYTPVPPRDKNNWSPRFGFNYRFGQTGGPLGALLGDGKTVLRGGYSRTYDLIFNNIALNVGSAFPFVVVTDVPLNPAVGLRTDAYPALAALRGLTFRPTGDPNQLTRTIVSNDFRSPFAEQFSLQLQRELAANWGFTLGWVGTKGTALFQTVDGNPVVPGTGVSGVPLRRVDPTRGVVRLRCNCTSSTYNSLQTSVEKRFSRNYSLAAHYTWSTFIDGASEIFNPSNSGEVAVPQDSFNWTADRGRSSYDRPHRFTANGVFELPFLREQQGLLGRLVGGWQLNGFLTFQSGAPFSALNGADPGARLQGISGLVGNAIRPNVATDLDLSRMTVSELRAAGGASLFRPVTAQNPIGNLGRNVLRADGIQRLDFGIIKNVKVREGNQFQIRADFFNATNTLSYGIPEARINSAAFLAEEATDGGNRRIQLGLRYVF